LVAPKSLEGIQKVASLKTGTRQSKHRHKSLIQQLWLFLIGSLLALPVAGETNQTRCPCQIAIIIDDIGYNATTGRQAIELPANITFAVIPFAPHASTLALRAAKQGREIMLHLPMEGSLGARLDPGGITRQQSRHEVKSRVRKAISAIPWASGFNNHMGSRLTTDRSALTWVMQAAQGQLDFFIDSMTSPESIAANIASHTGIPTLRRDVFLDPLPGNQVVARQFDQLLQVARTKGYAIAIGHPYPATLALLEQRLPDLHQQGFEVVSVSRLVQRHYSQIASVFWDRDALINHITELPVPKATIYALQESIFMKKKSNHKTSALNPGGLSNS
jgi:polysaccharide deacetylase 2 family uncharacterized protein YibQ